MVNLLQLLTVGLCAGACGVLAGLLIRRRAVAQAVRERDDLRRRVDEMAAQFARERETGALPVDGAAIFPGIVRRLFQRQRRAAVPGTAVRAVRDLLAASRVAWLAPVPGTDEFAVEEAVGFPPGRVPPRVAASPGVLAAAARGLVVTTRADDADGEAERPSAFEEAAGRVDVVIPVGAPGRLFGMIVAGGVGRRPEAARPFLATLGDVVAAAFQGAMVQDAVEPEESTDPLTGLADRAGFVGRLEREIVRATNYEIPLSLVLLDVDDLRAVNDAFGRAAGDTVMGRVAEIVRERTRRADLAARCGGKEIAILMATSDKNGAFAHAESMREAVAATPFSFEGREGPVFVTVSGGVAAFPEDGECTDALIRAAGEAVAKAEEGGRNRVVRARRAG